MTGRVELQMVYLKPGEVFLGDEPSVVVTVLGSCLSVTMFHKRRGLGGMCHGLMPQCEGTKDCIGDCADGLKYVDCSIRRMIQWFDKHKIRRSELEVKYFGGADMFSRRIERPGLLSIGQQNIAMAERILKSEGLHAVKMDVGGMQGRKIFFYTHSGEVLLKRLRRAPVADRGQE